jgi:hydrogenase expression/formation protein HypC
MCLTLPVRVISVDDGVAVVEVDGLRRTASTLAVPEAGPGDWAILAAGLLLRVLDPAAAHEIAAALHLATDDDALIETGGRS